MKTSPRLLHTARGMACAAFLALVLSGCVQYQWSKPNTTQADYNQDVYACNMEAARAYPAMPAIQPVGPGYIAPGYVRCGPFGCYGRPGYYMPPAVGTVDINQDNRDQAASQCMMARGWQLTKVRE